MIITGLLLGTLLGAVLQRGRFCVTGMLRDITTRKTFQPLGALFIVIAIGALGVQALTSAGVIHPELDNLAPAAVIIGSLLFGIGIVLAGGCASGTWYRAGEGLVGSWLALIFYAASSAAMKTGILKPLNDWLRGYTVPLTSAPELLHLSPWIFVLGFIVFTGWYLYRFGVAKPVAAPSGARKFTRPLTLHQAAILVGLIGVAAWPLSAATGRNDGLGITTPSKNVVDFIATGQSKYLDWGTLLVLGILLGSIIASKLTGEFRVRVPDATQCSRSVIGGILMGVGASWAGGCTVGNGMVQTSLFTFQGWIALAATFVGVTIAAKVFLKPRYATSSQAVTDKTASVPSFQSALNLVNLTEDRPKRSLAGLTQVGESRYRLDTLGEVCPFPLVNAKEAMDQLSVGDELEITFDCTQATDTLPRWAEESGHSVSEFEQTNDAGWRIVIAKGSDVQAAQQKLPATADIVN